MARAEHHDADLLAILAQALDQVQAAAVGQADVDDGKVMAAGVEVLVEFSEAGYAQRRVAQLFQKLAKFLAQHGFVFQQDHLRHAMPLRMPPGGWCNLPGCTGNATR
ncbi:hypothetical protein D3C72_1744020 [compost metagenome]